MTSSDRPSLRPDIRSSAAARRPMDACSWLLDCGGPPEAIRRIRPRDAWLRLSSPRCTGASEPRGAYDVHHYADLAAARDGIENCQVYGAIVMVPSGPQLLVASAASPAIADALRAQAARIGGGRPVKVTDVVPAAPNDPQGTGSLTTLLPLVLLSLALGIAIAVLERRRMLP